MDKREFSDEELTAFLDGQADDALAGAIEAALGEPDVAARLAALEVPMADLAEAGRLALDAAPSAPSLPVSQGATGHGGMVGWVAAAVVGAALGVAVTLSARPDASPDWVAQVASYQALYVAETLSLAPQPRPVAEGVLAEFAAVTGLDMAPATGLTGAKFERAQMLGIDGAPLLQMVFALPDGTPVALCVMPQGTDNAAVRVGEAEGLALSRWQDGGFGFVVIGGTDGALTRQLAEQARKELAL